MTIANSDARGILRVTGCRCPERHTSGPVDGDQRYGWNRHVGVGRVTVAQIGEPIRRYTVIPLDEPVSPTKEPATPPPPNKVPSPTSPVTKPESQPVP